MTQNVRNPERQSTPNETLCNWVALKDLLESSRLCYARERIEESCIEAAVG